MSQDLAELLSTFRSYAKTEREKGSYFERLAIAFLENDPQQVAQFENVWTYSKWAEANGLDRRDTGIDLVAKLREEEGYCAVQCKFYGLERKINKSNLDSFFTASGKKFFTRRLIIDTTDADWSEHAERALSEQSIQTNRIGFAELSESPIDWGIYKREEKVVLADKKKLRPHQQKALEAVEDGFRTADRGKLILACGTGKTFTGLKIAEKLAGEGKFVLVLVPSLSLMSQTVREWTIDAEVSLRSFAVCSDTKVGKRSSGDDIADLEIHDLAFPATTDAEKLAAKAAQNAGDRMTAVFSTYQSIQVISDAQKRYGFPEFDLIICDEAHRTTGAIFSDQEESHFVKVHRQEVIQGKKRLYMTATPRIFGDGVKTRASEASVELCSMDDPELYGEVFFERGFSWAVRNGLLTDYKVIVLAVDEGMVSSSVQRRLTDQNNELVLDDATKIIGCYKALTKTDLKTDISYDPHPMRKALAFCKDIRSSKLIANEFRGVVAEHLSSVDGDETVEQQRLECELEHVDGTFDAKRRTTLLDWLKAETDDHTCRILSNARCMSEGVDVPALDAILFLHPRKSQIDVVQAVGRVMRRAEGKRMGYVILPVGIPAGMAPEQALNDNEKYRVVWQILNALRAHDDRFDATINKLDLGVDVSSHIEVIAVTNQLPNRTMAEDIGIRIGQGSARGDDDDRQANGPGAHGEAQTSFVFDEFASAILAKIVKKCGKRTYWEDWATDIAKIAQTHITRIKTALENPGTKERDAFDRFLAELRDDINESVTEAEAIEMLAQHLITKPVFETLFEGHSFTSENPVSKAMQSILDVLQEQNLEKESQSLQKFYDSVKVRASGIDNAEGKQRIIVELYEKFFKNAFPRMADRLGIVYTPVEVVDFIIHSVNEVLQAEFGQTLGSKGVHIIDPFVGTGTFITRLLQSGLISKEEMEQKYRREIHANEIVLLAYYIAAINIEAVYHSAMGGEYVPFEGICLTDTFQMYEKGDMLARLMPDNSERRKRQKKLDIRVIMGNPPYSVGQSSANDNNANLSYPSLDARIRDTYAARSKATLKNALYDSYVRAIRWGSDRLGNNGGVMAYVTNAGWIDGNAADGLRQCLAEEFSSLYVFHLRGNARTSGEQRRKEKGNIFGEGSRAPVAITLFVKNPRAREHGRILFHDIGDHLNREEKLKIVCRFASIQGIADAKGWQRIEPNEHNDWLNQRDGSFEEFIKIGDKRGSDEVALFENYSSGVKTNRDAWCVNFSRREVEANISRSIAFYNSEVERYQACGTNKSGRDFAITDPTKISWDRTEYAGIERGRHIQYDQNSVVLSIYRPFCKQWTYFNRRFNNCVYKMPAVFPRQDAENLAIALTGQGSKSFSVLLLNALSSFDALEKGQCFPLKLYKSNEYCDDDNLFANDDAAKAGHIRDGITDAGLKHFLAAYPDEKITKEDIFYYVYGLLHSEDYRTRYADTLSKELPRIPCIAKAKDFWTFSHAGRALGDLHVNYESVEPYPVTIKQGDLRLTNIRDPEAFYRVEKMKFAGKRPQIDKSTVIYNANITMQDIPLEAYDFVVNGKPALEWVMERQTVKTDKESGIVNDANRYAVETVGDPAYPLKLFQRVITVSLETMKIVKSLPPLDIAE